MRNRVINRITEFAKSNKNLFLITGDLGFGVVDEFKEIYPNQFINVGIAEQNMMAIAAGLAKEGNKVFVYSIGNFPTLRCIEQIRNLVCYHDLDVTIIALGGGFAYGSLGMTHHATEDIAMMRALPNMRVYVPADAIEAERCLEYSYNDNHPTFIRLARGKEAIFHDQKEDLNISKVIPIQCEEGEDIAILTTGTILSEGIIIQKRLLREFGIKAGIYSVPSVKPLDLLTIKDLAINRSIIVTVEEHNNIGGLGGAVAETLSEMPSHARLIRCGLEDVFTSIVGDQGFLREMYGLSNDKIINKILDCYKR